jgi:hypothetical protein
MVYDVQLTVIIYKKKYYISHLAAIALGEKLESTSIMQFGNRTLIEVKPKDRHLVAEYPVYDVDSMLQTFVSADKSAEIYTVNKKDCFVFDGMTFISLAKMKMKNKYSLRFSFPALKIFGTYYVLCGKQKDVNTRIVVIPE